LPPTRHYILSLSLSLSLVDSLERRYRATRHDLGISADTLSNATLAVRHQLHRKMSKRTSKESTHLLTYITSRRVRIYRSSATCIYTLSRPFLSFCFCSTLPLRESSKHRADSLAKSTIREELSVERYSMALEKMLKWNFHDFCLSLD